MAGKLLVSTPAWIATMKTLKKIFLKNQDLVRILDAWSMGLPQFLMTALSVELSHFLEWPGFSQAQNNHESLMLPLPPCSSFATAHLPQPFWIQRGHFYPKNVSFQRKHHWCSREKCASPLKKKKKTNPKRTYASHRIVKGLKLGSLPEDWDYIMEWSS